MSTSAFTRIVPSEVIRSLSFAPYLYLKDPSSVCDIFESAPAVSCLIFNIFSVVPDILIFPPKT